MGYAGSALGCDARLGVGGRWGEQGEDLGNLVLGRITAPSRTKTVRTLIKKQHVRKSHGKTHDEKPERPSTEYRLAQVYVIRLRLAFTKRRNSDVGPEF